MFLMRHGVCMEQMSEPQREAGLDLMRATLSTAGFETARDIMSLNETIGEITGQRQEYGEWLYCLSIFGEPSDDRALGLADRRPPPQPQLLRPRRPDGAHARFHGLRARRSPRPASTPARASSGRAGRRAGAHGDADAGSSARRPSARRSCPDEVIRPPPSATTSSCPTRACAFASLQPGQQQLCLDAHRDLRRPPAARPRRGADGRSQAAPRRDLLRLDRRHGDGRRLLATASTARSS